MATYTLSNRFCSFAFIDDLTYGFQLLAMLKLGQSHTWGNSERRLWQAKVWDSLDPTGPSVALDPDRASLAALTATRNLFQATWTALPVLGGDAIDVLYSASLDEEEDFLRIRLEAHWNGTPTRCAIDTIGPCFAWQPLHQGSDVAAMAAVGGILSRDPIEHLRYAASPGTQFFALQRNEWFYPSGHGWSLPLWGYYETEDHQGWMIWFEEEDGAPVSVRFESDATNLIWEANEPQPDHVVIGNHGMALGLSYCLCLRPMTVRTDHGWFDQAAFYKARYEATRPLGYVAKRADRTDLSEEELKPAVFIDISASGATHALGDGKPGDLVSFVLKLRQKVGIPPDVPLWGTLTAGSYNLNYPGEAANGDLAAKMVLLQAQRCYLSMWYPGLLTPDLWDSYQWLTTAHAATERRWHTDFDVQRGLRMSRNGYLSGAGLDHFMEDPASVFWRERTYTVVSWNGGTLTATVSGGTPNADGFVTTQSARLVRGSTIRIANANVTALGATTITLDALPTDVLGVTRTPTAGDSLVVTQNLLDNLSNTYYSVLSNAALPHCPHLLMHAASYLAAIKENALIGPERNTHICGRYFDAWHSLWNRQINDGLNLRRTSHCYADHSAHALVDAGYAPHPLGGGKWQTLAFRELAAAIREAGRSSQRSNARMVFTNLHTEFSDNATIDLFDVTWTPLATMDIWRQTAGVDPSVHKYLCAPIYAMVHSGRHIQRALNQEISSALADPGLNLDALRKFQAYCLSDWPYGMTAPAFSFFQSDTIPIYDLFNDAIYQDNFPAGSVHRDVRRVRDLWIQVIQAQMREMGEFFRTGDMLAPAAVDLDLTDTTTGLAQTTFANDYHTGDVLYDRATYPRVTHCPWKGRDGTVKVAFLNWTFEDASWAGTFDVEAWGGFGNLGSAKLRAVSIRRTGKDGTVVPDADFDHATGKLTLDSVPALSVTVVTFRPSASRAVLVPVYRPRWQRGSG